MLYVCPTRRLAEPWGSKTSFLPHSRLQLFITASAHPSGAYSGLPVLCPVLECEEGMEGKIDTVYISAPMGDKKTKKKSNSEWKTL